MKPATAAYAFLLSGVVSLGLSILSSTSILALVGLGLTFWGALLLFIQPTRYVKASILDATTLTSLRTIDQVIADLDYKGKAVYLPPRQLENPDDSRIFISSKKNPCTPPAEEVATDEIFLKNPKGICLTPPGLDLANLYEGELGRRFTEVNLSYLQDNLPRLFVENLELAEDLQVNVENQEVQVSITGSIHEGICREARRLPHIHNSVGCPICSSIAIALTRATNSPVYIDETVTSEDGKTIEARFQLLESIGPEALAKPQTETLIEQAVRLYRTHLMWNLASLVLSVLGSIVLAFVGWLIWYDTTVWSKDFASILLGSRATEPIGLGIDMRGIHYLIMGLGLFLSGLLTFLRTKLEEVFCVSRRRILWNLARVLPTVLGLITLAYVGYLIWYDMTFWGKDIALILFQDRMIESYSLGIGLRIIHYLIIGLALLLSGLLALLRTRRTKV